MHPIPSRASLAPMLTVCVLLAPGCEPQGPKGAQDLLGSWGVSGPQAEKSFVVAFGPQDRVTVLHEFGASTISPWSYRDGAIVFGGMIRINEIRVGGTWKTTWKNADEIDVTTSDGQRLVLKRHAGG